MSVVDLLILIVATAAGALAAVTGFGIGSLLTPLLAVLVDTRLAVAAVALPHVIGTALRFWLLKGGADRRVLWTFGLTSAAGGLAGAALQGSLGNRWLNVVFGALLLFAAVSQATGLAGRMRFRGAAAWLAGALSGLLGGLVGNQGGIRSAALLGFDLPKRTFVATATAIALFVDGARLPIYLATQSSETAVALAVDRAGLNWRLHRHRHRQQDAVPHSGAVVSSHPGRRARLARHSDDDATKSA